MAEVDWGLLQAPDYFGGAMRAYQVGRQTADIQAKQNALRDYTVDPAKGIRELMAVDPATATALEDRQAQQQARQRQAQVGAQYASGDTAGARTAALQSGDFDLVGAIGKLDDAKRAELQREAEVKASAALSLKSLPYEQRKPALAQMAPQLTQSGLTPDQIAAFDPTDQNIDGIINQAVGIKDAIAHAEAARKPIELDPGKNYYLPDSTYGGPPQGGGQGSAPPAAAPAGGPRMPASFKPASALDIDTVWQAVKQQESGGNGNAVNPQTGATGSTQMMMPTAEAMARKLGIAWNPGLMRGDTPRALAYQDKLGRAYFEEGLQNSGGDVAGALAYYFAGPDPAQHGPKTAQYVSDVLGRLGAQPYEVAANGATPPPPAASIPGYHLVQAASQQWQPDGKGALINVVTGDRKKDESFQAPDVSDPNVVKGLLEGRIMPPTQKAAATPYWQAQLQAAAAQDPNFDMVNYGSRAKTRADFTAGKSADNITALNTVIGHLNTLDSAIDGLNNTGGFPGSHLNNTAAHLIARESGTGQRLDNFTAAKTAVANELTRVFRGTGGAEADIQGYLKQLDDAKSPQELHATVRQMAELINSRLEALGERYNQGMGTTHDPLTLLTPDKQQMFARIMGVPVPETAGGPVSPGASATPAPGNRPPLTSFYRQR